MTFLSFFRLESIEDADELEIKPPQNSAIRKERSHKRKRKDKQKDKPRERHRERDRERVKDSMYSGVDVY